MFRKKLHWDVLTEFIPEFNSDIKCIHGNEFDSICPKEQGWIQSRQVRIYDTEFVSQKERVAYYRRTINNYCTCKQFWTGNIILNCSRELGKVVHLVSYSLLHSYVWFYAKGGLTRSAFLRAYQNRMLDQYGVPESDLLT